VWVEENKDSGIPEKWEGILKDAKLIERIHQEASNVDPFPTYEICYTDEVRGKSFLLIRILEGMQTPYLVFNDPNFWMRTGNIKKAIDLANPKQVELLFEKKTNAERLRSILLNQADEIFESALIRAEKERLTQISEERRTYEQEIQPAKAKGLIVEPFKSIAYPDKLGRNSSMCEIYLQPYSPDSSLMNPQGLLKEKHKILLRPAYEDIKTETTPYGIVQFLWSSYNGYIECHQIFSKGLVYYNSDVEETGSEKNKMIMISFVVGALHRIITATKSFYEITKYQGSIVGGIALKDVQGMRIRQITPNGYSWGRNHNYSCLLPEYHWGIEIDTSILFDTEALKKWFYEKINEIYIFLGLPIPASEVIDSFCKQESMFVN
jgi:hypothetical protein